MGKKQDPTTAELATQPFFYEIRVRGHLCNEQWTAWFSNLTISANKGESVLRGTLPDHAALYGLLARLRDLAVPLLSVKVLDAEDQRKLHKKSRRFNLFINLLLLAIYLTLMGGLVAITTILISGGVLHTALGLAMLFAVLGVLSYVSLLWGGCKAWQWLAYGLWGSSVITFLVFTAVARLLPTAASVALLLFLGAGGLIYLLSSLKSRTEQVNNLIVDWESLANQTETTEAGHKDESIGQGAPQ